MYSSNQYLITYEMLRQLTRSTGPFTIGDSICDSEGTPIGQIIGSQPEKDLYEIMLTGGRNLDEEEMKQAIKPKTEYHVTDSLDPTSVDVVASAIDARAKKTAAETERRLIDQLLKIGSDAGEPGLIASSLGSQMMGTTMKGWADVMGTVIPPGISKNKSVFTQEALRQAAKQFASMPGAITSQIPNTYSYPDAEYTYQDIDAPATSVSRDEFIEQIKKLRGIDSVTIFFDNPPEELGIIVNLDSQLLLKYQANTLLGHVRTAITRFAPEEYDKLDISVRFREVIEYDRSESPAGSSSDDESNV